MLEKAEVCDNCGTKLAQDEYDSQRCGKCGWIRDARPRRKAQSRSDYRVALFVRLNTAHEALMAAKHVAMGEGDVRDCEAIVAALGIVESFFKD